LPLGAAELEFGQVRVQRRGGEEITSEQAALARAITEETSQALERARLFRDTQDTLIEVGTLYRSSRAIIDAQSPQGVLEAVVENVAAPELDQMILLTLERSPSAQTWLNVAAVVDRSDEVSGLMGRRWSATALPGLDEITDDLVVFGNGMARGAEHASTGRALLTELGLQAALVAPLSVGPRRVGWLVAGASAQPYAFSDRERRLYGGLTDLAAAVVRNFQLLDLAEGRAARAQALSVISGRMRETLDMDLILQTTLREIGEKLGISNIEVRMRGGGR